MSETPGEHLDEEPQEERGPMGSRDTGSSEPGGGPVDRPEGTAREGSGSSVDPQGADEGETQLPTGDGG
jgi:hypothetical protein